MACIILGDSIGVGVHAYLPQCVAEVKVGIRSASWLANHSNWQTANTVVISLGANDLHGDDYDNLFKVREEVKAKHVIWLLPANVNRPRANIEVIAKTFHDQIIDVRDFPRSPDGIHPTGRGYRQLAAKVRYEIRSS